MKLFQTDRHTSLLHAINEEVLTHQENLQRALDGKSAFYIPNGGQREQIETEQARLKSMQAGIGAMQKYWQVPVIKPGQDTLSPEDFTTLRVGAGLAYMQATHCQLESAHPTFTETERQGLLDLFLYFDCKLDARNPRNDTYYTYDTLHQTVGYIQQQR